MSKFIYIEVNQETVNYVEGVNLESNSRKSLLNSIAETLGVTSKAFRDYQKEFIAYDAEYQLIKQRLQEVYIPAELTTHDVVWNLNFQKNLMEIEIKCQCGIDLVDAGLDIHPNFAKDDVIEKFAGKEVGKTADVPSCTSGTNGK